MNLCELSLTKVSLRQKLMHAISSKAGCLEACYTISNKRAMIETKKQLKELVCEKT